MKIFQILNGVCYADLTYTGIKISELPPDIKAVEAPDNVFLGWGYDENTGEFIRPEPPSGWAYDENTGTFYKIDNDEPPVLSDTERITILEESLNTLMDGLV